MRHGKTFRKRCLTFLLSLAMVLTSVNVPMLTVWAEEATPTVNDNNDTTTPQTDDGKQDSVDDDEEGDVLGEGTISTDLPQDETKPEDGENLVGGGINLFGENDVPAQPIGLVAEYQKNGDNKGKIKVEWGAPGTNDVVTKWEIFIDEGETPEASPEQLGAVFLENKYEAGTTHTVKLYAVNNNGESEPATTTFKIPAEGEDNTDIKKPSVPAGVEAGYWSTEEDNKGKIRVAWGSGFGDGGTPTSWEVYIDSKLVGTEGSVAAYFYDNTYAAGTHTVKVVAVNDIGKSAPAKVTFTLTSEQAGGTDADEGDPVGTGDTLVDSAIDFTALVPATDNSAGTKADIWNVWTNIGVTAKGEANSTITFTYPSGRCATDWALQLQTDESIEITEGEYYTLAFTMESSIPRSMGVCMGGPYNARYNELKYRLPANRETEVVYVFKADATAKCKIQFLLGTQDDDKSPLWEQEDGHTLKLSQISLATGRAVAEEGANATVAADTDKAGLKTAIEECEALKADDYEEESFAVLTAALTAAKSVSEAADSTKKAVDEALADLQIAEASLHEAGYVPPADPVTMVDPINFEEVEWTTYAGGWGGDQNVKWAYDKTVATITADSFGWQAWTVQWQTDGHLLESPVDNNVFEFDVVSATDKNIVFKDENTTKTTTLELKAGETKHYAQRVSGKSFGFTFDLSGGAGKLTFSNMKFGEELSYYNFKEQADAGNIELYVGTDWSGATANGTATEDSYTISATNFGGENVWGIQLQLKNFIDIKTTSTYKIGAVIESTVDKDITVKLGNPEKENDVLAINDVSLKANTPQTVELESTLWDQELASTLFFACGNKAGARGDITISKLYVVPTKPTAQEAPVLKAGKKNDKQNGYRIGQDVELLYNVSAENWAGKITSVSVNKNPLTTDQYTVSTADHKITVNAGVFTKYDVYDFVITADNYMDAKIRVPVYAASVDNEDWKQEWADEFEGSALDTTKWDYELGVKSGDDDTSDSPIYWGNNEKEYYTKEAVTVQDGKLVITANALTDEIKAKYNITDNTVKYSSGRIRTISEDGSEVKYATTYGRIEAMMELPKAPGYWPAFWGLPTPETIDIYGTWAASGELDIMEAVGQDGNYVNGTIHYGSQWPNNIHSGGSHYFEEGDSIEGAHLYAVEWEPGELRWYVDDILYHVENNWYAKASGASDNYAYPAPFDEDFYLLFNLAISGEYVSNQEPAPDELGKSMKVDYIRVYKDSNVEYGTVPDAPPSAGKDTGFFEANKQYADDSGNYLKDPEFTTLKDHQMGAGGTVVPGLGYWSSATDTGNGAKTEIGIVEKDGVKYAKIDVKQTGSNNYDIQLIQHVPLAKGYTYKLTFDAYTDVAGGRNFAVAPKGDADNGWAGYDAGITPNLKTTVQSFEHIFTMQADSDPTARIEMNIGNASGTVYIGNARLVALTDQELEDIENEKLHGKKTPLDNGEHIYNGTFDQGKGKLAYWDLEGDYKADTSKRSMRAVINASSDINDAAIKQTGLQLLARDTYRLTLKAKADAAKKIKVGLYSKQGVVYALAQETVDTNEQELVLEFTMPDDVTDEEAVLIIAFGGDTVPVEIDNISMIRTTNLNVTWDASTLYPLGGETWPDYTYHVYGVNDVKTVPADGVITEPAVSSTNNYDYMIYRDVSVKAGYTYDLSFDIKTDKANQKVTASVQQDGTWIVLVEEPMTTSTDWQTVKKTFKAEVEGAVNLKFLLSDKANSNYNVSLRNVTMTMEGAPYLAIKNPPSKLVQGATFQINASHTAAVNPDYEEYIYASSQPNVATVSETGLITAVAAGTTTITVTSKIGATKSFTLTVVTEAGENADTTQLAAKITDAEKYLSQTDKYSDKSLADLKAAIDAAKAITDGIANGVIYEQSVVDSAMADIESAVDGLEDVTGTDKAALKACVDKYKGYKESGYTPETWAAFKKALEEAQACLAKGNATQQEIDAAVKKLENAADALKKAEESEHHEGLWIRPIPAQTYTGAAIKPEIEVRFNDELLELKKDYTVAYKNNTNAGTATVTVTGKGNFKDRDTAEFKIEPKNIGSEDITVADVYAIMKANGTVTNPKVTVKFGKKTLKNNSDYRLQYPDLEKDEEGNIVAKDYKIAILTDAVKKDKKGNPVDSVNYTGSREITYTVCKKDIILMSKAKITLTAGSVDYADRMDETKRPQIKSIKINGKEIAQEQWANEFEITDTDYEQAGKATITVTGKDKSKYYGSKSVTYTVNGTKLVAGKLDITGLEARDYTGQPIFVSDDPDTGAKGTLVVKTKDAEAKTLAEGTDYEVSYKTGKKLGEHTNVGTVTVMITGINAYTGSVSKTFKINQVDLATFGTVNAPAGLEFTADLSARYTKDGAKPKITSLIYNGTPLVGKKDYTVSYAQNKTVKKGELSATMTITGKGNFKGKLQHKYEVTVASKDDVYATAVDIVKPVKFSQVKSTIKVFETETGKVLKVGTDYDRVITYYSDEECTKQITADNFNQPIAENSKKTPTDVDAVIYAKIVMKGNYAGAEADPEAAPEYVKAQFRVYDKDLKMTSNKLVITVDTTKDKEDNPIECDATKNKNPYYTGKDIEPKVTVTVKDSDPVVTLEKGRDYEVKYTNNKNKGKATITVTGIGNGYGGTKSVKFSIVSKDMKWYTEAAEKIATFFSNLF